MIFLHLFYLPARILIELIPLGAVKELVERDEGILVLVDLVHDMFPHSVHLLVSLHHVVFWSVGIIDLVELGKLEREKGFMNGRNFVRSLNKTEHHKKNSQYAI